MATVIEEGAGSVVSDRRWWLLKDPEDVLAAIRGEIDNLVNEDGRRNRLAWWRALYTDENLNTIEKYSDHNGPIRRNVARNAADALHARMVQAVPAVEPVTEAGDWKLQKQALKLGQWLAGEFDRLEVSELFDNCMIDALVEGDAVVMGGICPDTGQLLLEQVPLEWMFVPLREQKAGKIRTSYYAKRIDKEVLAERYPKKREEIMRSSLMVEEIDRESDEFNREHDCTVIECWRLPYGKRKGRRMLVTSVAVLEDDTWEHRRFPWVRLKTWRRSRRFWSQGLIQRMYGPQADVTDMANKVEEMFNTAAPAYWFRANAGSAVTQLENRPFRAYVTPDGAPPQVTGVEFGSIMAPFTQWGSQLATQAYEDAGISQLSASSLAPTEWSGKAQIVHQDVESVRFKSLGDKAGKFVLDLAKLVLWLAPEAKDTRTLTTGDLRRWLSFEEIKIAQENYRLQLKAKSKLSNTISARIQEVLDMMQGGLLDDPDEAREMLEMPDLKTYNSLRSAGRDAVRALLARAEDLDDDPPAAHGALPLPYAIKMGTLYSLKAEVDGAPPQVVQRLTAFVAHCKKVQQKAVEAQQAAMQPPPMPGMPPGAPPGAPGPAAPPPAPQPGAAPMT